jgi:hypothetical protein
MPAKQSGLSDKKRDDPWAPLLPAENGNFAPRLTYPGSSARLRLLGGSTQCFWPGP